MVDDCKHVLELPLKFQKFSFSYPWQYPMITYVLYVSIKLDPDATKAHKFSLEFPSKDKFKMNLWKTCSFRKTYSATPMILLLVLVFMSQTIYICERMNSNNCWLTFVRAATSTANTQSLGNLAVPTSTRFIERDMIDLLLVMTGSYAGLWRRLIEMNS